MLRVIEPQEYDGMLRRISSRQSLQFDRSTVLPPIPRSKTIHPAEASDLVLAQNGQQQFDHVSI